MSEKKYTMGTAVNWQDEIAAIAGPYTGNRKNWLSRAAKNARVSYRQVRALWYRETENPRFNTGSRVLSAAEDARRKASDLASRFESTAGAMHAADSDFYSDDVLTLIDAARALRGLDRT